MKEIVRRKISEIKKLKKEIVGLKKNNCPFKNIRYVGPLSCRFIRLI